MEEIKEYKCPECGKEMERGYTTTTSAVCWVNGINEGKIYLGDAQRLIASGVFSNPKASSLKCKYCRLVLFRY